MPSSSHEPTGSLQVSLNEPLNTVCGELLVTTLPAGPYRVPAMLQSSLLLIANGGIQQYRAESGWQALPAVGLYGPLGGFRLAEAQAGTRILFLPLRAGALFRLFGMHAAELRDQSVNLAEFLSSACLTALVDALASDLPVAIQIARLEAVLLECWHKTNLTPTRALSLRGIDATPLAELADANNLSPRQFERLFRQQNGFSLRHYRRQARCQSLLLTCIFGHRQAPDWAALAATAGYYDQAHLLRDFRTFTGYTPADLLARIQAGDPATWPYREPGERVTRMLAATIA